VPSIERPPITTDFLSFHADVQSEPKYFYRNCMIQSANLLKTQIMNQTMEVFEDKMLSILWLNTPNSIFECHTPLHFSNKGTVGVLRVLTVLGRMQEI